ncbi:hypothetical protein, partial [Mycobacterium sp.]|uniref:hypothetical protein n=1 Tax=Mycobacterium sp. TaxID=1785 RepID=UPI003BB03823
MTTTLVDITRYPCSTPPFSSDESPIQGRCRAGRDEQGDLLAIGVIECIRLPKTKQSIADNTDRLLAGSIRATDILASTDPQRRSG